MNRRGFFQALAGAVAGSALPPPKPRVRTYCLQYREIKDLQRQYNYIRSQEAEMDMLSPHKPWIVWE